MNHEYSSPPAPRFQPLASALMLVVVLLLANGCGSKLQDTGPDLKIQPDCDLIVELAAWRLR